MTGFTGLITGCDTRQYFHEAVERAVARRRLSVEGETVIYLVNMLNAFIRSERLYEPSPGGPVMRPLCELYGAAVHADSVEERDRALKRLGDMALFISGFFSHSLGRSLVDVDYYMAMGERAYGFLADSARVTRTSRVLRDVFSELARKFADVADVLYVIGEDGVSRNSADILRLYEIWLSSGSRHAAEQLQALGIQPISVHRNKH